MSQRVTRTAFISNRMLFGTLAQEPKFAEAYLWVLASLFERGAHATVSELAVE